MIPLQYWVHYPRKGVEEWWIHLVSRREGNSGSPVNLETVAHAHLLVWDDEVFTRFSFAQIFFSVSVFVRWFMQVLNSSHRPIIRKKHLAQCTDPKGYSLVFYFTKSDPPNKSFDTITF